jgi:hypothetical protein
MAPFQLVSRGKVLECPKNEVMWLGCDSGLVIWPDSYRLCLSMNLPEGLWVAVDVIKGVVIPF